MQKHKFEDEWKSIDGILTQKGRVVGADESTVLWRHPYQQATWFIYKHFVCFL